MTKQLVLDSAMVPSVFAKVLRVFSKSKPTGEYAIHTPTNAYYLRLWYGMIVDAAPVIRDQGFLKVHFKYLLDAIKKKDGSYELYSVHR